MNNDLEKLNIKLNLIKARKKLLNFIFLVYLGINVGSLFMLNGLPNVVILTFILATCGFYKINKLEKDNIESIKLEIKKQHDLQDDKLLDENNKKILNKNNDKKTVTNNSDYIMIYEENDEKEEKEKQKQKVLKKV